MSRRRVPQLGVNTDACTATLVRLPRPLHDALNAVAHARGVSNNLYMVEAIKAQLLQEDVRHEHPQAATR